MGYELTHFVDEVQTEFICPICMMVLENPLESPCEHIFCSGCINGWITAESNNSCPVDRQVLLPTDLKPPRRYYRNLLDKLKVRCEMEHLGCPSIFPLENHQTHNASCIYKPNSIVECDKGCNLRMTRREYQDSCLVHVTRKFNNHLAEMKKHMDKLSGQLRQQREVISRLVNKSKSPLRIYWKKSHNMKPSTFGPDILEPVKSDKFCFGFVQYYKLDKSCARFRTRILNLADQQYIVIGLTQQNFYDEMPGHRVGSIGYYDKGEVVVNGRADFGLQKWQIDDVIECGLENPNSFDTGFGDVYFSVNDVVVVKKRMRIPPEGLFPTIRLGTFTTTVPKVECLTY